MCTNARRTARSMGRPPPALLTFAMMLPWVAGCRDAPSPDGDKPGEARSVSAPTTAQAPPVDEAEAPEGTVPGTAAQLDPAVEAARKAARDRQLDGMRSGLRKTHFVQQIAVPLPAGTPDAIARLVPPTAKLVEFEIHRRMHQLAPKAGRRVVVRWLTRLDGALGQALARRTAGIWLGEVLPEDVTTARHPEWGTLTWSVRTPEERATRVEMVLEGPDPAGPLALPPLVDAPWRATLASTALLGFEHGQYHARQGAETYTDLERLSAIAVTDDGPGLQRRLEEAVLAAGYKPDDDDARLLRAPGKDRTTFTTRLGDGRLTLHHQRRWRRSPPAVTPSGKAAKP